MDFDLYKPLCSEILCFSRIFKLYLSIPFSQKAYFQPTPRTI